MERFLSLDTNPAASYPTSTMATKGGPAAALLFLLAFTSQSIAETFSGLPNDASTSQGSRGTTNIRHRALQPTTLQIGGGSSSSFDLTYNSADTNTVSSSVTLTPDVTSGQTITCAMTGCTMNLGSSTDNFSLTFSLPDGSGGAITFGTSCPIQSTFFFDIIICRL